MEALRQYSDMISLLINLSPFWLIIPGVLIFLLIKRVSGVVFDEFIRRLLPRRWVRGSHQREDDLSVPSQPSAPQPQPEPVKRKPGPSTAEYITMLAAMLVILWKHRK